MDENQEKGAETPSSETLKIINELENAGYEFNLKKQSDETDENKEETLDKKPANEEDKIKTIREPRMVPAWQIEIDRKRIEKEKEQEKNLLLEEIKQIRSDIEEIKQNKTSSGNLSKENNELNKLSEKYDVSREFLDDLANIIGKSDKDKLDKLDKLMEEQKIKSEDLIFEREFENNIISSIQNDFPDIKGNEIKKIKEKIKEDYFHPKYTKLDIEEIYKLRKDEYEDYLSPKKYSSEKGTKGIFRNQGIIDYDNITEEEFEKLTPAQIKEFNEYKSRRQK